MKHHIWCNDVNPLAPAGSPYHPDSGGENCDMCRGLRAEMPDSDQLSEAQLRAKYFPGIVPVER